MKFKQYIVFIPSLLAIWCCYSNALTYNDAGVSINAADRLVENIKHFCRKTNRPGCLKAEIGNYGTLFDLKQVTASIEEPILVSETDGVRGHHQLFA